MCFLSVSPCLFPKLNALLWAEVGHLECVCIHVHNREGRANSQLPSQTSCFLPGCSCAQRVEHWEFRRPWGLFPLPFTPLQSDSRNARGSSGDERDRFFFHPPPTAIPPVEAAPARVGLSSHIALISYNLSFSISPPRD